MLKNVAQTYSLYEKLIVLDERKNENGSKSFVGQDLRRVPKPLVIKFPEITGHIKDVDGNNQLSNRKYTN